MKIIEISISLLLIISTVSCDNTKQKSHSMQEQLRIRFKPSFIPHLDFEVILNKDKGEVLYKVYRPTNIATGLPPQTILYDSLKFEVSGLDYQKFVENIKEINLENYKSPKMEGIGLDGILKGYTFIK